MQFTDLTWWRTGCNTDIYFIVILIDFEFMNNICKQLVKFDKPPYFKNEISSVPVVLSDSKGFYLKQHLDFPNNIQWCSKRGATTVEQFNYLKPTLQILLQKYSKITVFVWLGTCDLTYKDESGFISLASKTDDVVNNI